MSYTSSYLTYSQDRVKDSYFKQSRNWIYVLNDLKGRKRVELFWTIIDFSFYLIGLCNFLFLMDVFDLTFLMNKNISCFFLVFSVDLDRSTNLVVLTLMIIFCQCWNNKRVFSWVSVQWSPWGNICLQLLVYRFELSLWIIYYPSTKYMQGFKSKRALVYKGCNKDIQ